MVQYHQNLLILLYLYFDMLDHDFLLALYNLLHQLDQYILYNRCIRYILCTRYIQLDLSYQYHLVDLLRHLSQPMYLYHYTPINYFQLNMNHHLSHSVVIQMDYLIYLIFLLYLSQHPLLKYLLANLLHHLLIQLVYHLYTIYVYIFH